MKKMNLSVLTAEQLNDKEMKNILGGNVGVPCSSSCGSNYSASVNKTLKVMRDKNLFDEQDTSEMIPEP